MIILGITGGIGSGKTTVTSIFSLMNIPIYIADIESKRITATSPVVRKKLISLFGNELYNGKELNKPLLASHIFTDKCKMDQVNAIIHPEVENDFKQWLKVHKNHKVVVHEAAILFESGFNKFVDKTITVYTPYEVRIERTMKRDNSTREEVVRRINNQMTDETKKELSDFVIVNDNKHSLIDQVCNILKQINVYSA